MRRLFAKAAEKKAERLALGKKGFTLIELLVVIAIIGILVLIAVPSFLGYTKQANVTTMAADAKVLTNAALVYEAETNISGEETEGDVNGFPTGAEAEGTAVSGVVTEGDFYELREEAIKANVQSIKNDIEEYVIDVNTGNVYHKEGVKGKDDKLHFGHGEVEK